MPVAEVSKDQRYEGIDSPGMEPPVKEGNLHCLTRGLHGVAVTHGWVEKMHHRLGHAEEHQPYPHARRKQHGEPGGAAVVRGAVIRSQLDIAVTTQAEKHDGSQDDRHGQDVELAQVGDDPALDVSEHRLGILLK